MARDTKCFQQLSIGNSADCPMEMMAMILEKHNTSSRAWQNYKDENYRRFIACDGTNLTFSWV
jgi:hypothetical protein